MATIKDALKLIEDATQAHQLELPNLPEDPLHLLSSISIQLGIVALMARSCVYSGTRVSRYQKTLVGVGALVVRALVLSDGIDMTKFKPKLRTDVTPKKGAKRGSRKRKA